MSHLWKGHRLIINMSCFILLTLFFPTDKFVRRFSTAGSVGRTDPVTAAICRLIRENLSHSLNRSLLCSRSSVPPPVKVSSAVWYSGPFVLMSGKLKSRYLIFGIAFPVLWRWGSTLLTWIDSFGLASGGSWISAITKLKITDILITEMIFHQII